MTRPYTGFDAVAKGTKPGLKDLVDIICFLNQGKIADLGTWTRRDARGKPGIPSIHGTGRAADLGWFDRKDGERLIDWLVTNADTLGLELLIDYHPRPFGRAWRCDRHKFKAYLKRTVAGAPGGHWIHIEISPEMAKNGKAMEAAIKKALGA